ncbi:hypothetical protein AD998_18915 [bacterium 336/3]|nr:hypothetical protein AD998_18915 [bacterium 336/3]
MDGVYFQVDKMQCLRIGEGERNLFAFHGFGQNPEVFNCLRTLLPNYTIYSFDLLSFGKTPQKDDINELIQTFCKNYQIKKFSVVAFSIGAKMALSIVEKLASQIEKICLVAPDGFKKTFWYEFAVSWIGKPLFWRFIQKPHQIFKIAYYLQSVKLIKNEQIRMAQKYTESAPKRFLLWRTWLANQYLYPSHKNLQKIFATQELPTQIFLAEQDELIASKPILHFAQKHNCIQTTHKNCSHFRVLAEVLKSQEFLDFFKS